MDKLTQEEWDTTIDNLGKQDEGLRTHFAKLIMMLAKCYDDTSPCKAVVLVDTGDAMLTFSAGADEMEMTEMVEHAYEMTQALAMRDAPPKEMFN
jgi:hypothetical protein